MALEISDNTSVLVLTGAGVSAESGIQTFRASDGLWEKHAIEDVASPEGFFRDPALVWRFYSERRRSVSAAQSNAGHLALCALEEELGDRFLLATQNVDGLHERAGSKRVLALHGRLMQSRCSVCERPPFDDDALYLSALPMCARCEERGGSGLLRPHIVWFGEALDPNHLARVETFMNKAEDLLFLAVGTSGHVYPAAALVSVARALGGRSVLVNLDEAGNEGEFDEVFRGPSGVLLPSLLDL